jgi:hypothetical protein
MPVIGAQSIGNLTVEHTPEPENRAHAEIFGLPKDREQLAEARLLLLRITVIVIPLAQA